MPRPTGSRAKKTLATERQLAEMRKAGVDPKDYLIGILAGTVEYDEHKFRAAETLMEFMYAKLSRQTIDGNLNVFKHEQALKELE